MTENRKRYGSKFRAKVALEAIRAEKTAAELASAYGVHVSQITRWKKRALEMLPDVFHGHLVKERMGGSGMRWSKAGAQGLLDLRSIRVNGDWEAYQGYHRHCEQHRLYGNDRFAGCSLAEVEALGEGV